MLLELYSIQLGSIGFGKSWHYAFIILGAEGTFIALEQLLSAVLMPDGLVAVLALHIGSLVCGTWPFLTLAVVLVRAHIRQTDQVQLERQKQQQQQAIDVDEKSTESPGSEPQSEEATRVEYRGEEDNGDTTDMPGGSQGLNADAAAMVHVLTNRWKHQSRFSGMARAATVTGFVWWCVGIGLLVVNWVWLQVFVLAYMKVATTPTRISIGLLLFNASEFVFGKAVIFTMRSAELQREDPLPQRKAHHSCYHSSYLAISQLWAWTVRSVRTSHVSHGSETHPALPVATTRCRDTKRWVRSISSD